MEASLTCAVCLGVFRDPVTLPLCSHNFCKSCVAECAEPQSRLFPHTGPVAVPCPLCRKVSSIHGGIPALPVNTTLAELARLLTPTGATGKEERLSRTAESPLNRQCPDHPEHLLELYCKNCARACCGKCVSAAHQGIFHSVNLLDMVYQEEKLMFFNSLQKLREMYEKVTKEGLDDDQDIKDTLQKNADMVNSAFDEVQKALDLKRQHLLDSMKPQESAAIKRHEMWKRTTAHHKITLEHLLKDSEAIVDEVEPKCFLKVSCSLNQRMKSHLHIMALTASHCHDTPKAELSRLNLQPVIDAISDLKITATLPNDPLPIGNADVSFKTLTRTWEKEQASTQKYNPVQNQELCYLQGQLQNLTIRLLSITEMPEYRHLSFEELRMKYYKGSTTQENEVPLTEQCAAVVKDNQSISQDIPSRSVNAIKIKSVKSPGGCSNFKSKPELAPQRKMKMESGQNDGPFQNVFKLSQVVEVGKEPGSCFLRGATGGASTDIQGDKETVVKETNLASHAPAFCLGRSDATAINKPWKNERIRKKVKPVELPATVGTFQGIFRSTNKSDFTFSSTGHSKTTQDTFSFRSSFTHLESKAQESEVPGELAAQANCNEEFYDAVSNASSDTEETE